MDFVIELAAAVPLGINLNSFVGGGVGAAVVAFLIWFIKLMIDRMVPTRSDSRADVTLVLSGLNNMVKVLQEEKIADATRLTAKQQRIDLLESAAEKDYDRINDLHGEIIELRNRLATKNRHINTLVSELRKLGSEVTGIELEDLEITHTPDEVKEIVTGSTDSQSPVR